MKTFLHIWLAPIILGIISAVGLVSALTGDNIWDVISWVMLLIPLSAGAYFLVKSGQKRKRV
ncbi:MAG: hypothetical protein EOP51_28675 [Sphingobacteriales bacterium]|nr:MAG: hypothetical protein EOP51_28675 [Sphingobacteriales bacterium]